VARINLDAKALLNQNYILKVQRLTAVEIDEIRENIRLEIGEATEDYTNEANGDRTDANGIEYQKRDKENENTDCGKAEINKHPSTEEEQHTVKNKLKEDLQIMWHKVRPLQMSEREKLPRLKTNSKLTKLQEEINGVIEELLEEEEMNITDINNLIYAAATIMTQTLNEPSKRSKNRDAKFWKIRMQKQISN
jgi:Skp family chaperone for outer membrane proteins